MTVQEKMEQLEAVKADIKQALIDKDIDMTDVPFTDYAGKIAESGKTYLFKDGIASNLLKIDSGWTIKDNILVKTVSNTQYVRGFDASLTGKTISAKVLKTSADSTFVIGYTNSSSSTSAIGALTLDFSSNLNINEQIIAGISIPSSITGQFLIGAGGGANISKIYEI